MFKPILSIVTTAALAAACHAPSPAPTPSDLVKKAELVVLGTVSHVSYQSSEGPTPIPHTYVEIEVEEVLKGSYEGTGAPLTLRFAGGVGRLEVPLGTLEVQDEETGEVFYEVPAEASIDPNLGIAYIDDAIFTVSETTLFDVGERTILMVRENGSIQCPLVDCAEGRFRVVGDFVFAEDGRELFLDQRGDLTAGAPHPIAEWERNIVGNQVVEFMRGDPMSELDPDDNQLDAPDRLYPDGESMLLNNFLVWLDRQVASSPSAPDAEPVLSLDPATPFSVPSPTAERFLQPPLIVDAQPPAPEDS
jgi:hypothetical protein